VLAAIDAANAPDSAYAADALSMRLDAAFSALFEHEVAVLWVATGTAANCLALAEYVAPHQGIICHREAHIEVDEGGGPGFYTHGAKLILAEGDGAMLTPDSIVAVADAIRDDVHQVQPAAVSITQASEYGRVYSPASLTAIGALCRDRGWALHMDGARFANAAAHLACHPADISWRAGVDVLSFGCVKNGGMNGEALIFFDPSRAAASEYRRKRAGHLQSKGRFLAAQLLAMVEGDLWLANARTANAAAQIIAQAANDRLLHPVEANEIFLRLSAAEAARLRAAGFDFYDWGPGAARLVTSWHHSAADVAPLAHAIAAL
jgi:threonine aldolase